MIWLLVAGISLLGLAPVLRVAMTRDTMVQADSAEGRAETAWIRWMLLGVLCGAGGLYAWVGTPELARTTPGQAATLLARLYVDLARLPPDTPAAREGYLLLGRIEAQRGNPAAAAQAWERVLAQGFDPVLAVDIAQALVQAEGHLSSHGASLVRQALAQPQALDAAHLDLARQLLEQPPAVSDPAF